MDKVTVIKLRTDYKAKGAKLQVYADNGQQFEELHEFLIWDDENEILTAVRINPEHQSQFTNPIAIFSTTYEFIQYIEGLFEKDSAKEYLNGLENLTDKQKETLSKFIDAINNQNVEIKIPEYTPFKDNIQ